MTFNTLLRFLGLGKVSGYMERRKAQLRKQGEMDTQLEPLESQCPQVIIDFYKLQRKVNRINSYEAYNTSIITNFGRFDDMLQQVDKMDNRVLEIKAGAESNQEQCTALNKFVAAYDFSESRPVTVSGLVE